MSSQSTTGVLESVFGESNLMKICIVNVIQVFIILGLLLRPVEVYGLTYIRPWL